MLQYIKGGNIAKTAYILSKWSRVFTQSVPEKEKLYVLPMFPYPSGKIHMGHVRVFSISDTIVRYKMMRGYDVLHPMGWDAFGLPAENAAIDHHENPLVWTENNIREMRGQVDCLNCRFDWDREINTSDPDYYKWTQWLFLKLWEKGYVERRNGYVNWDPVDRTVLANEQVDAEGKSWRSGAKVEQKMLSQWYILTTKLGKELLDGLKDLPNWPSLVKTYQEKWIGMTQGVEICFKLDQEVDHIHTISAFTTQPEFIYDTSFVAISPSHPLSFFYAEKDEKVKRFLASLKKERFFSSFSAVCGIQLPVSAIHPITKKIIPVLIANYVTPDFGNGAVMGTPCQNIVDFRLAKIMNVDDESIKNEKNEVNTTHHAELDGLSSEQAAIVVTRKGEKEQWCKACNHYRLQDWLISRQRYWGAPVPAIHCKSCGVVPVPYDQLPVVLPKLTKEEIDNLKGGNGTSPLARQTDWIHTTCPCCGRKDAVRDTDTLDTFMDSSWYFYRYLDPHNPNTFCSKEKMEEHPQVNYYVGGDEHSIMHLLFSRFISHFLFKEGYVASKEPFNTLITQGMVLGETYIDKHTGQYYYPEEIEQRGNNWYHKESGEEVLMKYMKMSKSKHNGIDPTEVIQQYNSDIVRIGMLMQCPSSNAFLYNSHIMEPASNMISKMKAICQRCLDSPSVTKQTNTLYSVVDKGKVVSTHNKIIKDMDQLEFHTVLASINILLNILQESKYDSYYLSTFKNVILFINPFAPLQAEICWSDLQAANKIAQSDTLSLQRWPEVMKPNQRIAIIQINGKMKRTVTFDSDTEERLSNSEAVNLVNRKIDMTGLLNFNPKDIKVIQKGCRIILNYIK